MGKYKITKYINQFIQEKIDKGVYTTNMGKLEEELKEYVIRHSNRHYTQETINRSWRRYKSLLSNHFNIVVNEFYIPHVDSCKRYSITKKVG
jgi:hypothetical protein